MNTSPQSTPKVEPPKDEIEKMAEEYANRIGSPWGEGATYEPDRPQKTRDEGVNLSHLDDSSKENFIKDLTQSILDLLKLQQEALLSKVEAELPSDDVVTSKYGYSDRTKKYGFRIGMTEAKAAIDKLRLEL